MRRPRKTLWLDRMVWRESQLKRVRRVLTLLGDGLTAKSPRHQKDTHDNTCTTCDTGDVGVWTLAVLNKGSEERVRERERERERESVRERERE